jgi:hypothetical protein
LAIALSLANLCFLNYWISYPTDAFYRQQPDIVNNLAAIADILLLGLAFWGLYTLARLSKRRFVLEASRWAFVLVLLIPFNLLKDQIPALRLGHLTKTELIIVSGIMVTVCASAVARWRRQIIPALALLVLLLFPFTFFTFGRVLVRWFAERSAVWSGTAPLAPSPSMSPPSRRRVLWIIFDEMDERLTFIDRLSGLRLPETDRLRDESLWASNAFPPAGETLLSMPSLINGRIVTRAKPQGTRDLLLTYEGDEQTVNWRNTANVFSRARDVGYKTAVVGWSNPYDRVIGSSLDFCQFFQAPYPDPDLPFFPRMLYWTSTLPESIPLLSRLDLLNPIRLRQSRLDALGRIKTYQAFCKAAIPVATNRDFNLILLHWPIPHSPYIYSRSQGGFDSSGRGTYIDNLALVDRTIRELRQAMETAGVWDSTTVLLSADHWNRYTYQLDGKIDHRVPFLLKLARQTTRLDYNRRFDTVATHDLILSILRGELQDPESVARWLDQRSDPNPFAVFDPASPKPDIKSETALVLKSHRTKPVQAAKCS